MTLLPRSASEAGEEGYILWMPRRAGVGGDCDSSCAAAIARRLSVSIRLLIVMFFFGGCKVSDAREHISDSCGRYRPVVVVLAAVVVALIVVVVVVL